LNNYCRSTSQRINELRDDLKRGGIDEMDKKRFEPPQSFPNAKLAED